MGPTKSVANMKKHGVGRETPIWEPEMKKEYDFSGGIRGPVLRAPAGKTRITIRIDDDVLQWFRGQVHAAGGGNYQSLINAALRECMERRDHDLTDTLRTLIREEFGRYEAKRVTRPRASSNKGAEADRMTRSRRDGARR